MPCRICWSGWTTRRQIDHHCKRQMITLCFADVARFRSHQGPLREADSAGQLCGRDSVRDRLACQVQQMDISQVESRTFAITGPGGCVGPPLSQTSLVRSQWQTGTTLTKTGFLNFKAAFETLCYEQVCRYASYQAIVSVAVCRIMVVLRHPSCSVPCPQQCKRARLR